MKKLERNTADLVRLVSVFFSRLKCLISLLGGKNEDLVAAMTRLDSRGFFD